MRKLLHIITGKKVMGILFLAIQLWIFYIGFYAITENSIYIFGGSNILAGLVILFIINRDTDDGIKISWMFLILAMPVFGISLYYYVRLDLPANRIRNKLRTIYEATSYLNENDGFILDKLISRNTRCAGTFKYIRNVSGYPPYSDTEVSYFPLGDDAFPVILEQLQKATSFIFIEFFIINEKSEMWSRIYEILLQKVNEGVEVRVVFDGMGSFATTSFDFADKLRRQGIKCEVFASIKPFLSTYQNNRDHRKIIVIDGKVAFSGGINLADEYINKRKLYGHWKDNAVMFKGAAVKSFLIMFLRMWNVMGDTEENFDVYTNTTKYDMGKVSDGYVAPFDDSPFLSERVGNNVYADIINGAVDYVYIMTPYLVLDEKIRSSLKYASARGVDVRIVMPHIPDKWVTFSLSRTYYPELISAGVKVYEYVHGFVHSKTTLCDGERAVVGTINYDYRSMYMNYECATLIQENSSLADIKYDFDDTFSKSKEITLDEYYSTSIFMRLVGRILRVFAPLM